MQTLVLVVFVIVHVLSFTTTKFKGEAQSLVPLKFTLGFQSVTHHMRVFSSPMNA